MHGYQKFNQVDYSNVFAQQIKEIHRLCQSILQNEISDNDKIIDLGGGPGISAKLIDELRIKATILNLDPANNVETVPISRFVEYLPTKISFQETFSFDIPWQADKLLLMSSAHEIALAYGGKSAKKNKLAFLADLRQFMQNNLKQDGRVIISFPGYAPDTTKEQIQRQRIISDRLLGHSHPYEEFFYLNDFAQIFPKEPLRVVSKTMTLASAQESCLTATVAVFTLRP